MLFSEVKNVFETFYFISFNFIHVISFRYLTFLFIIIILNCTFFRAFKWIEVSIISSAIVLISPIERLKIQFCTTIFASSVVHFRYTLVTNDVVIVSLYENETKTADSVVRDYDPELVSRLEGLNQNRSIDGPIIPILVIACNRISIRNCLNDLIRYRPNSDQFPIIVSQVRQRWLLHRFSFAVKCFHNFASPNRIVIMSQRKMWLNHSKKFSICGNQINVKLN